MTYLISTSIVFAILVGIGIVIYLLANWFQNVIISIFGKQYLFNYDEQTDNIDDRKKLLFERRCNFTLFFSIIYIIVCFIFIYNFHSKEIKIPVVSTLSHNQYVLDRLEYLKTREISKEVQHEIQELEKEDVHVGYRDVFIWSVFILFGGYALILLYKGFTEPLTMG